ncbi:MAG: hypothetical protein K0S55_1643, partial [Clostridia bacterium]|nr:hypothetical protein [Clostridia bacterium]
LSSDNNITIDIGEISIEKSNS